MIYADTDFFLALIKEKDWLKARAGKLLQKYRGRHWTSVATVTEIMLLCQRFRIDPNRALVDVLEIAQLRGVHERTVHRAAFYMAEYGLGALDALHASFAQDGEILSSDKVFDRVPGLKRVALEDG